MVLRFIRKEKPRITREEEVTEVDKYSREAYDSSPFKHFRSELEGYASSYYTVEGHIKAIEAYNIPRLPEPDDAEWNSTKQHIMAEVSKHAKCAEAISYHNIDAVSWKSNTSAGYGYTGTKGEPGNYERARSIAYRNAREVLESNLENQIINATPDVAFTRTQLSLIEIKQKVRQIWGEAFHYILLEGLYAQPLIEYFQVQDTFYFIGKDPLLEVPPMINEMFDKFDCIYSLDWSNFDATVQPWEIRFAFRQMKTILKFQTEEGSKILDFLEELFILRPVLSPTGEVWLKDLGIPSGSYFTSIVGSMVNYARIQYLFKKSTDSFVYARVQGDDSLIGLMRGQIVQPSRLSEIAAVLYWLLNEDKCELGWTREGATFLKRRLKGMQMHRVEIEVLRKAIYPEYRVDDPTISAARCKALWLDTGARSDALKFMYRYLESKYGIAEELPEKFKLYRI